MNIQGLIAIVHQLINLVTPVVIALALLFFFWGLATFILGSSNEEERKKGRNIMIYGILALFIMVSIWGIIAVLQNTFELRGGSIIPPLIPAAQTP
jgi:thiol:disulfide interchange protein